ncbi:MAG TPA: endonuclease/exonuclease/phosphatase family protein [Methylomirabilota bacterium]|nr:endonuclease/exonuclease/phosphatase family protein [Methylomirabilota bacterium]
MHLRRFVLILLFSLSALALTAAETSLKVMTFNLRFASDKAPNSWPERRPVMKQCIQEANADVIGTQEGVYHQLLDMERDLPHYRWIGLGREGGSRGEFMAIFYKPERLEPLQYDHYWLSDTPEVIGSVTWGHSVKRMVTWVRFKDLRTKREFYLVNTHFDHQVQGAREKSAELVLSRVKKLDQTVPIIVMGDFNATAGSNKAYTTLTADDYLKDTWHTAKEKRGEVVKTFHNFKGPVAGDDRIDWILGRGIDTAWTQILTCNAKGQYPSDHFPIIAEITLK